jgi:hypothetical protein
VDQGATYILTFPAWTSAMSVGWLREKSTGSTLGGRGFDPRFPHILPRPLVTEFGDLDAMYIVRPTASAVAMSAV